MDVTPSPFTTASTERPSLNEIVGGTTSSSHSSILPSQSLSNPSQPRFDRYRFWVTTHWTETGCPSVTLPVGDGSLLSLLVDDLRWTRRQEESLVSQGRLDDKSCKVLTERVNVLAWDSDSLLEIQCAVVRERHKSIK